MTASLDDPVAQLNPGLAVQTFDGRRLGIVQAVGDSGFLVRRKYREGFWLPSGLIRSVDENRVLLHISSRVLPRYSKKAGRGHRFTPAGRRAMLASTALLIATVALTGFV